MKTLITAVALTLATLTSFAQETSPAPEIDNFVSTRTRAEVRAEVLAAMAGGWRPVQGEVSYAPEQENFVSARTRAEVRSEVLAAMAGGERLSYGNARAAAPGSGNAYTNEAATMAARQATVAR